MADSQRARKRMVELQIQGRGVRDPAVLAAMLRVPREQFVPADVQAFAYDDAPLPIGQDQTISQPYIVAFMVEAMQLGPADRVLEVGTGSGYAAAVLAEIASEVVTIERHAALADQAARNLAATGYGHVQVIHGDGSRGWPDASPYNAILVSAGSPTVPESLKAQLATNGRLVLPVGDNRHVQELVRITRIGPHSFDREDLAAVRFVPLIGAEGWDGETGSTSTAARSHHPRSGPS